MKKISDDSDKVRLKVDEKVIIPTYGHNTSL